MNPTVSHEWSSIQTNAPRIGSVIDETPQTPRMRKTDAAKQKQCICNSEIVQTNDAHCRCLESCLPGILLNTLGGECTMRIEILPTSSEPIELVSCQLPFLLYIGMYHNLSYNSVSSTKKSELRWLCQVLRCTLSTDVCFLLNGVSARQ